MKNLKLLIAFALLCSVARAQQQQADGDEIRGKFKKENIFMGTSLNIGLANHSFNAGLNPEIGYSITKWLDGGFAFNINYFSQNATDYSAIRFRNFNFGGGPFLRVWPLSFLNLQIQPEYNWISSNQKNVLTGQSGTYKYQTGSLLVGVGYGSRMIGSHYSSVSLMIDVLQNINSPYRDQYNDPVPVLRASFGFYLKGNRR